MKHFCLFLLFSLNDVEKEFYIFSGDMQYLFAEAKWWWNSLKDAQNFPYYFFSFHLKLDLIGFCNLRDERRRGRIFYSLLYP